MWEDGELAVDDEGMELRDIEAVQEEAARSERCGSQQFKEQLRPRSGDLRCSRPGARGPVHLRDKTAEALRGSILASFPPLPKLGASRQEDGRLMAGGA